MGRLINGKNGDDQIHVNTYGYADRNYTTGTALTTKMFDTTMEISISLQKEDDSKKFDYNNGVSAYVSVKDAKLLAKKITKSLAKFEDSGNFKPVSIPLNKGVIEILTVGDLKKKLRSVTGNADEASLCVVIYTDLNEHKIAQQFLVHVFNTAPSLDNYQPENGSYTINTDAAIECENFADALYDFGRSMNCAIAHSIKNEGKRDRANLEKIFYEIAISQGVDLSKSFKSNGNASSGRISWTGENNNEYPTGNNSIASRSADPGKHEVITADQDDIEAIIQQMQQG